jgi:hypothetical protein
VEIVGYLIPTRGIASPLIKYDRKRLSRSYSFYDVIFDLHWESFVPLGVESCIWQAVEVASKATKNAS